MSESTTAPTEAASAWSDAELMSAVAAYLLMLKAELAGELINKAQVNRELRDGLLAGRTKASVEFRMQNISAALVELQLPRIKGYVPARNIGTAVKEKMVALLGQQDLAFLQAYRPTADADRLAQQVTQLLQGPLGRIPSGARQPKLELKTVSTYVRDPAVKAWILKLANGICEGCHAPAPFNGTDGLPYLEVHHVMPLASYGSDTPTNAVALCPNCHRRCHYAQDRDEFKLDLYEKIPRLQLEVPEPIGVDTNVFIAPD